LKTNFPILQKTAATDSAGYTDADLKKANVWYSVTADEHNFYYTAYADNFGQAYRSSILVCRSREDASLVYDVNIHNFNLDTSSTRTNSKVIPALFGDTLYLTTGGVNNLGLSYLLLIR